MKVMDRDKRVSQLRGYIYGLGKAFKKYGTLTCKQLALLKRSAKEIEKLGCLWEAQYAKTVINDFNEMCR